MSNTGHSTEQRETRPLPSRNRRQTSRTRSLRRLALIAFCVMLVSLGTAAWLNDASIETSHALGSSSSEFASGVYIESVDLSNTTLDEARLALLEVENDLLASVNLTISTENSSWTLGSGDLGITTDMDEVLAFSMESETAKNTNLTLTANEESILSKLQSIAPELWLAPLEPSLTATLGEDNVPIFDLQEGRDGRELDVEATVDIIMAAISEENFNTQIEPVYTFTPPAVSDEQLMQNTAFRGGYVTDYRVSSSDETTINRVFNIHKTGEVMNNTVLQPGEEWSFNTVVGLRTADGGWKDANGISGGKEFTLQVGGGVCQPSTTLFNALIAADIEITDRKAHSIPVDYVEPGLDATVDSSGIDFKYRNDTDAPLYVFVYFTPNEESSRRENIHVDVYGVPLPEGVTYQSRAEIVEETPRDPSVEAATYVDDPSIPYGYEVTLLSSRPRIETETYQDKYLNGELVESIHLFDETYRGNTAEIAIGTGNPYTTPIPDGATIATRQPTVIPVV